MFVSHLRPSPLTSRSVPTRHLRLDSNETARCHLYLANTLSVYTGPCPTNRSSACVLSLTRSLPLLQSSLPFIPWHSLSFTRSRPAHGACNFHVVSSSSAVRVLLYTLPNRVHLSSSNGSSSRTSEPTRSFALSRARVGADEGERHPLKSSWEPITRVTQGRTHRVSTAPKILLRPRLIDRLKPKIMIVAARNESWKKGAAGAVLCPWRGLSA